MQEFLRAAACYKTQNVLGKKLQNTKMASEASLGAGLVRFIWV